MGFQRITAWSFSRWKDYEQCPLKAKYKHVDKMKEPPAPAMERGSAIHKLAENFAKGELRKLPPELKLFSEQFAELKKSRPMVEESWAFTDRWSPTDWFAFNAWLRVKTDAACLDGDTLYVIDHKTGKKKDDHADQLSLYAVAGMLKYPAVRKVVSQLWYLDSGEMTDQDFDVSELPGLQKDWVAKTKAMLNDMRFSPKPGNHCRWCSFSKSKGGPCKF